MLTVETYLAQPAAAVEIVSAAGYFRATKAVAADPAIATRAREAGTALGADPPAAVAQIATRVLALVETQDDTASIRTIAGDIRLRDYLPTRTFELAVHTADLATALGLPPDVPATAAAQALWQSSQSSPSPTGSPDRCCSPSPAGQAFPRLLGALPPLRC